jgi:multisubunit Na+/H+ antiporter MnhG subunit
MFVFGMTMVIMVISPVFALLATISMRMLIDPTARLSAADTFTTLALIMVHLIALALALTFTTLALIMVPAHSPSPSPNLHHPRPQHGSTSQP